jgi:hypothetical protein
MSDMLQVVGKYAGEIKTDKLIKHIGHHFYGAQS